MISFLSKLVLAKNIYPFIWKAEQQRGKRQRERISICSLIQQPILSQAKGRSKKLHPGLPHGWQALAILLAVAFPGASAQSWMGSGVPGPQAGIPIWDASMQVVA